MRTSSCLDVDRSLAGENSATNFTYSAVTQNTVRSICPSSLAYKRARSSTAQPEKDLVVSPHMGCPQLCCGTASTRTKYHGAIPSTAKAPRFYLTATVTGPISFGRPRYQSALHRILVAIPNLLTRTFKRAAVVMSASAQPEQARWFGQSDAGMPEKNIDITDRECRGVRYSRKAPL